MTREEMWEEFENQLKREVHTPITMDYYNSIKFAEQGIAETVAKWKERLEQEPCEDCQYKEWLKGEVEQAPKIDGDCISREGAIKVVRSHWEDILHPVNLRIQEELKELPSVNPQEPKIISIPKGATNGDVFKIMFNKAFPKTIILYENDESRLTIKPMFSREWWEMPYKESEE